MKKIITSLAPGILFAILLYSLYSFLDRGSLGHLEVYTLLFLSVTAIVYPILLNARYKGWGMFVGALIAGLLNMLDLYLKERAGCSDLCGIENLGLGAINCIFIIVGIILAIIYIYKKQN